MYLCEAQARQLGVVLDELTRPDTDVPLRQRIVEPLAHLLRADYVASLVWDHRTARFRDGVCCRADAGHLRAYEREYQYSDPIAPLLRARRYPTRVSAVIPQQRLVRSEFFDRFLNTGAMYWGVNVFAHDGQRDVGDLRIWRSRARGDFDSNEMAMLHLLYPSLVNAFSRELQVDHAGSGASQSNEGELEQMLRARFALSAREAQVAALAAEGLADKDIARQLGVAFSTVRTYLGGALKKTGYAHRKALIAGVAAHASPFVRGPLRAPQDQDASMSQAR